MNESLEEITIRRIVVAADASSCELTALNVAAALAAELRSELRGLFVEDESLLRLAQLPFAREVVFSSAVQRQLDLPSLEHTMRVRARRMKQLFSERALQSQVSWSFEIVRGRIVQWALTAAQDADLVLIAREGLGPLVSIRTQLGAAGPVLVVYEATPAGRRALITAARLVRNTQTPIIALVGDAGDDVVYQLKEACAELFEGQGVRVRIDRQLLSNHRKLTDVARGYRAGLLLMGRDSRLIDHETLETLVEDAGCAVGLVVHDGANKSSTPRSA